ncbi:DNA polymerase III subunit delta' [Trueperella sp. LYQ141]|uniref:DNA polymerase III subunit delta' n=1 Tax=Trueperella sp. LYQ141 TaxID=3391058 RepID=UPI003983A311
MNVFSDVVGQEEAVRELQRAAQAAHEVRSAFADSSQSEMASAAMSHAWLITGPPGSGRSLAARAFAAALECTGEELGCGQCSSCRAVMAGNHPDVTVVSTDLVTISADEVRGYVASSYQAPGSGYWRVFIIEDADRMLTRTTNVLLKAIEEPGPRTVWMLCTAAVADVLPTIRSRCRNVNLVTPSEQAIVDLLVRRHGASEQEARVAVAAAQHHIGLAQALITDKTAVELRSRTLDFLVQVRGVGDAALAAQVLVDPQLMGGASKAADEESIAQEEAERLAALGLEAGAKVPVALRAQMKSAGVDAKRRATRRLQDTIDRELTYMISFFRDVLVCQMGAEVALVNSDYEKYIRQCAEQNSVMSILRRIDALAEARTRLTSNVAPQLLMESALMQVRIAQ